MNYSSSDSGGAVYFKNQGIAGNCIFKNCYSDSGGAIYFSYDNPASVINCAFVNNSANKGNAINHCSFVSLNDNWWGSNNPDWSSLIYPVVIPSSFAVLNATANPQNITTESNSKLNYTFYKNETNNLLVIPIRTIELSSDGGNLKNTSGYLINGKFSTEFSSNNSGIYNITTKVDDEEIKIKVNVTKVKQNVTMNIVVPSITEGEDATVTVILSPSSATGSVSVGDRTVKVNKGTATITIPNLSVGNNTLPIKYSGDDMYNPSSTSVNIIVLPDTEAIISAPELVKYYHSSERFVVILTDNAGNPLPNQQISIIINGMEYKRTTNSSGQASIAINLNSGVYEIIAKYEDINVNSKVTIKPTVYGNDVTKIYGNDTQYYATFLDSEGNYLSQGINVTFHINGIFYSQEIMDNKGTAKLDIDEKPDSYILTALNPVTGEMLSNTITVISNIMSNDLVKYYNESTKFSVRVVSPSGYPASGQKVKFTIKDYVYETTSNSNGYAFLDTVLQPNKYIVTTSYGSLEVNNTIIILPTLHDKDMNVSSSNIDEYEKEIIEVVLPDDATGKVSTTINSKEYSANVNKGRANIIIPDLKYGTYNIDVIYAGDSQYNSVKGKTSFIVDKTIDLSVPDVTKYYGGSERLYVTLKDTSGNPIANAHIKININRVDYDRATNANGQTSIALSIPAGKYTATVEYNGIKRESNVVIKSTVTGNDITKIYRNGTQYYAKFVDTKGNILKNTPVEFNINGVFYTRTTNENGIAKMNINLNPKEYIITATNPNSNEMYSNVVTVLSNIAENHDLTKYYKNASQYVIRLLDDKGNPVSAGISVEFNINGVFYTRTSNATGHVKMNINLNPGTYIITANYKGLMTSNTITVKPILQAKDLNMKYRDGSKFEVTLLDGKGNPFAGQKITFNINGVFYDRTTDASGIARLNINLMAGDYIITSMYSNGAIISNRITIYENPDAGYVYIDLPSYDTTTTVQSGNYRIEAHQWRSPGLGELDIYVYDSNGNMLREYDYDSKISDGTRWSGTYSTYEYATYHKWQFSPDIRMTQIAVKIK